MSKIFNDLWLQLQSYYGNVIELLPKLALAILVFSILSFLTNKSKFIVQDRLTQRMDDPLLARFLARIAKITMTLLSLMLVLKIIGLGDIAAGFLTGASVSAVVIGFAFKDIGENFLAGIILAFNRPFRVGDTVELGGNKGKVQTLDMRTTHIKSFDGKDIYIPNANVVKNPVINHTLDGLVRQEFNIGLDHGSDVEQAIQITLAELSKVEGILDEDKAPSVHINNINTNTLDLTIMYWINTITGKVPSNIVRTNAINKVVSALGNADFYLPRQVFELKNYQEKKLPISSINDQDVA